MNAHERLEKRLLAAMERTEWSEVERALDKGKEVDDLAWAADVVGSAAFGAGRFDLAARALHLAWTAYLGRDVVSEPGAAATEWYFGSSQYLSPWLREVMRAETTTPNRLAREAWKARACGDLGLAREAAARVRRDGDAWSAAVRGSAGPIARCAAFMTDAFTCQILYWADEPDVLPVVERAVSNQRCSRAALIGDWNLTLLRTQVEAIRLVLAGDPKSCLRAADLALESLASSIGTMDSTSDHHDRVLLRIRALGRAGEEGLAEYESFVKAFPALESLVRP